MSDTTDPQLGFAEFIKVFRRRFGLFFGAIAITVLVGVALAYRLPPVYESTGVLLAEQPEVPEYVVRSTVPNYPEERVRVITQRVLTSENLDRIAADNALYPELVDSDGARRRELRSNLTLSAEDPELLENIIGARTAANSGGIAFSLSFSDSDPGKARDVARDLVDLYLDENQRARREQAANTADFLRAEVQRLDEQIADRERRIAQFKRENSSSLPEISDMNLQLLDRTQRDLQDVEREIRTLREREMLYSAELAELSPHLPIVNDEGDQLLGPDERLKMLQRSYLQLSARYSDDHPDVRKVRREIEALSAAQGVPAFDRQALSAELALRQEELSDLSARYSDINPEVQRLQRTVDDLRETIASSPAAVARQAPTAPDNPVYIQRRVQLEGTRSELAAALDRRDELRARIRELEGSLTASPEVEREFSVLNRGYEQLLADYADTESNLRAAELALNLENSSRGERFTVLSEPGRPSRPSSPNRLAILLLTLVVAAIVGALAVTVAEHSDDSLRNARDVSTYLDMRPLVAIPKISNAEDVRRKRLTLIAGTASVALWVASLAFLFTHPAG